MWNVNFWEAETLSFFISRKFLAKGRGGLKFASFEGGQTVRSPWFYQLSGTKKAPFPGACSGKILGEIDGFLVQNVKN